MHRRVRNRLESAENRPDQQLAVLEAQHDATSPVDPHLDVFLDRHPDARTGAEPRTVRRRRDRAPAFRFPDNDAVSVDCSTGFVRVFDDGPPTTYTPPCAAVTGIVATATGTFDNTIDLSAVSAAAFTTATGTSISGGAGVDSLTGSQLNDSIVGGPGNETQFGVGGNDTFVWNPGDGSDTLIGGAGTDTMFFNGSAGNEVFAVTAQGAGPFHARPLLDRHGRDRSRGIGCTHRLNDSATVTDLTSSPTEPITSSWGRRRTATARARRTRDQLPRARGRRQRHLPQPERRLFAAPRKRHDRGARWRVTLRDAGGGDDTITGGPAASEPGGGDARHVHLEPGRRDRRLVGGGLDR